ncbi:hypothetical protein ACF1BE_29630 [Streptomyces sp. NPDC014991]|uniref:hypothetical protein n=1 Tax=Streptomyces sp. NPDC014991 TaxID=3364935 RepID=UPI003700534F
MSAVAASAAVLPRPRTKFAGETSRRRLRAVPAQAGPAVPPKLGNPLQLGKSMRARLLAAVRALVTSPALAGASDGARLASVVLTAKSKVADDYQASIWAAELGRWLGVSQSTVAHTVLPELRAAGFLGSNVATNAFGHATGLECWVIPMYRAQKAGDRRHPLALSRSELAVLLSLCEVLFGPGWAPKDKAPVPAGLLAGRTGRGAATDRLGLLLMVLTTGSAGWLQLCPGSVDTGRGRPAATVGRLLGCTAAAGAKVLKRLQEYGVAEVVRKEAGSGLNAQSRVRLVPVAEAHGVAVREARRVAKSLISDLADTTSGDLESGETGEALVTAGIEGAGQGEMAGSADLAATAQHHAFHASVVTPGGSLALSGGFSGEGRGGIGGQPERACVREDRAADGQAAVAESSPLVAEDGPLRGEKPEESPVEGRDGQRAAGAVAGDRLKAVGWEKAQQQRRVGLPADLGLRVALGPVAGLWARLSGWQQGQVEAAAQAELTRLAGMLERPDMAPRLMAGRFTDRLEETGGEALVDRPFPWLMRRGLVQRQACPDRRCDDGIRLDTGGDCASCASLLADRRAVRARVRTEMVADLPGAGAAELRAACERRLHEHTVLEAERTRLRHARVVVEVERRRAAAAQRREREVAAERARRSAPCAECGLPDAAGLCPPCSYARRTDLLMQEAVNLAVAVRADLDDVQQVAQLTARCETDTRALIAEVCRRRGGDEVWVAYAAQEVAERVRDERRAAALRRLAGSDEAVAEADAAYEAALRQRPRAVEAAEAAADDACRRAAGYLLRSRLGQLQVVRARAAAGRAHHQAA